MMLEKKKLVRNIASLGIIQTVNYIFPLITVPYVSRIIGPDGYGIINYATAFIGYFTLLIAYGFDLTATRRISQNSNNKEYINEVVSEVFTSRIILYALSCILFVISLYFFTPIQKNIYVSVILFIGCISTIISPLYIFQGFQDLQIFGKLNFVKGVLNTILIFIIIKKSSDYFWIPILNTTFLISINVFLFFLAIKKYKINFKFVHLKRALRVIVNERTIFFSTVVINIYTSTNTIILGFFATSKEIGYVTTAQNFMYIILTVLSVPITSALFPYIGFYFSKSKENGIEKVKEILPIIFYATFFASLLLFLFSSLLINFIYGEKFYNSIGILKIISIIPLLATLGNLMGVQVMVNMKMDKLFFKVTLLGGILGFIINYFMSKYYGYYGTAWSSVIVEVIVVTVMYFVLIKNGIKILSFNNFNPKIVIRNLKILINR